MLSALANPYLLYSDVIFLKKIVGFLLETQISNETDCDCGAWPIISGNARGHCMSTGHAIAGLVKAKSIYQDDSSMITRIDNSISIANEWVRTKVNADGGWGYEPADSGEGKPSQLISTVYVLKGLINYGLTYQNSSLVRNAISYIQTLRKDNGAYSGGHASEKIDACYTSRAVSILVRSGAYRKNSSEIKKSIKYILKNRSNRGIWKLDTEPYVPDNSSGQVVYNSNTVADVMEAVALVGHYDRYVSKLEKWFVNTQEHDGKWFLGGSPQSNITTWSTNEALYSLICSEIYLNDTKIPLLFKRLNWQRKALISFIIVIILYLFMPIRIGEEGAFSILAKIPMTARSWFFGTVIVGLLINLFSSVIYDRLKKWRNRSD